MEPLVLDEKALQKLGLYHEALYTIEYDLPSLIKDSSKFAKNESDRIKKGFTDKQAREVHRLRTRLVFHLKYKLGAIRNLDSSWFIDESKLPKATELLNQLKDEFKEFGFNMDKRIRIIPILTTREGFESYEDRKAEFLLQFLNESMKKVDKGLSNETMSETILWRCKKSVEIVESIAESLKHHTQYKVIGDTLVMLQDSINEYENIKQDKKEQKKLKKK